MWALIIKTNIESVHTYISALPQPQIHAHVPDPSLRTNKKNFISHRSPPHGYEWMSSSCILESYQVAHMSCPLGVKPEWTHCPCRLNSCTILSVWQNVLILYISNYISEVYRISLSALSTVSVDYDYHNPVLLILPVILCFFAEYGNISSFRRASWDTVAWGWIYFHILRKT